MGGSFQFSLSDEPLSMHNCADPVVWTQDRAETAWASGCRISVNNKAIHKN